MKSAIVSLMRIVAGFSLASTSSYGAVDFTAGTGETRQPGDTFSLPISVTGFQNVDSFQFSLVWDSSVLTLTNLPPTVLNSDAKTSGWTEDINTTTPGKLGYFWNSTTLTTLTDNRTLLTVEFTVIGGSGSNYVLFADSPTMRSVDLNFAQGGTLVTHDGWLTVVPEPVNVALGLFGLVSGGTTALRYLVRLRKQPPLAE